MNARALTAFACAIAALASLGSVPAAAGERLDNIVKNNTLRVGTPGDYRPFAMKEDSGYAGHDIDVVKAMAEVYGWKVEFVPTTWKQMAADLKDNRFDVAVGGITRSPARALTADFLPTYAPFGKVALVNVKMKNKFRTLDDLNQPDVRVIKNPGGTNEAFVLANLTRAKVSTHDKNFEIPGLIAEGRGDVMITENAEAKLYAKKDKRLHAAFLENPLTPVNYMGFMLPVDDPDYDHTLGVEDLQEGHDYEVIITSRSGFYRYKMRDAIRCVGHKGTMPTMEFLFRLDQTVNMHGEKTTELVLRKVADKVAARAGLDLVDFSVYPNVDHHPARYEYLFEFYHADHAAIDLAELSRITDEELRAGNYDVSYMTEDGTFAPGHRARAAG